MNLVRSLVFTLVFYALTPLALALGIVSLLWGPRGVRAAGRWWCTWHYLCAVAFLGIRTRIQGPLPRGAVLVASKHQSMFETMEMIRLFDAPAIIMKQELSRIPIWGWLARHYGLIAIDRAGGAVALRSMVRDSKAAAAEGRPVVIFPEGTRVPPGAQPPLQPGFAGLYGTLKLPVVPLALDSGWVWPRKSFVRRPGIVTFRFGETIPAGLSRRDAEARVHAAINALETAPAA
jgi:1-acyl-sn-glycerol-3-phosphate acyltransferase